MSKRQPIDEAVVQKGGVNEPPRIPRPSTPPPAQRPTQNQPQNQVPPPPPTPPRRNE